jgi:hypothetical protein
MIVVEIEPGFADADDAGVPRLGDERCGLHVGMRVGLVRVDADGSPHVPFPLRDGDDLIPFALPRRDVEHRLNARRAGAGEHALLVVDQALIVEVAMAVGEHRAGM